MTNEEILHDSRFRIAVQMDEYTRAISIFLRLKYHYVPDLSMISRDVMRSAQIYVDNAFLEKWQREKELAQEMR